MSKLLHAIDEQTNKRPNDIALQDHSRNLSYLELETLSKEWADIFKLHRIKKVGIYAYNSIDWVVCQLAAYRAGAAVIPIPPFFSKDQIEHLFSSTKPDFVFAPRELGHLFQNTPELQIPKFIEGKGFQLGISDISDELKDIALITFTSGSTGNPKGVLISHDLIYRVCNSLKIKVQSLDLAMHATTLPLSVMLENVAGVFLPLVMGKTVYIESLKFWGLEGSSKLNSETFTNALQLTQPSSVIATPEILKMLLHLKSLNLIPSSIQFIAVGGGKVPVSDLVMAERMGLPVFEGYGLTECGSVVSLNSTSDRKLGSAGKPLEHVKVSISEEGEILVSGASMSGYLGAPEIQNVIHTGDLGELDDRGFLHVKGRIKNVQINSFGRNFSPEWIESKINEIPGVIRSIVFGDGLPHVYVLIQVVENFPFEKFSEAIEKLNQSLPDYAQIYDFQPLTQTMIDEQDLLTGNGRIRRTIANKFIEYVFTRKEAI